LTQQFLQKSCREASREVLQLSGEAWVAMEAYEWPGNVRELRNVIERLVVLRRKPIVELEDLPELIRSCCRPSQEKPSMAANELAAARQDGELKRLTDALRHHNNNRVRAASELGVSRATVYRKLRQHGIT
jgi:DNA-binding NtrC family response regulator